MSGEISEVDLFGDPVISRQEGRGRPEHIWTRERSNKVLLAFARGLSVKDAATTIGISVPTLRKVYFSEVEKRSEARLRMEMVQLSRLNDQAGAGNVAAEKELIKQLDRLRQRDQQQQLAPAPTKAAAPKLGKKEAAKAQAQDVRGLYEPPAPPTRLN
ncbi:hypothetical protein [Sphingobium yanoikuyae]|uniref:hypothetical protein n=1 Tax=Sphingobium yanoikuyae TaxID=13690 RepID=UPI0028AE2E0D|nr:hypothetical protein [Sphingobium yanoikuyae]